MESNLTNVTKQLNNTQNEEKTLKKEFDADKIKLSKLEYKVKDAQKSYDNELKELMKEQAQEKKINDKLAELSKNKTSEEKELK